jgi:hypothetical protein
MKYKFINTVNICGTLALTCNVAVVAYEHVKNEDDVAIAISKTIEDISKMDLVMVSASSAATS